MANSDDLYKAIEKELSAYIRPEMLESLDSVGKDCVILYKKAISSRLYSITSMGGESYPAVYDRTGQLIDSVTYSIDAETMTVYIYHDMNMLNYHNVSESITGLNEQIPYWTNYGHDGLFPYHERLFLEYAQRSIENELGVKVEIMNPEPPHI